MQQVKRVEAILLHLVRCLVTNDSLNVEQLSSQRRLSTVSTTEGLIPVDNQLNYVTIESIPPLPMYSLLAADTNTLTINKKDIKSAEPNHEALFDTEMTVNDDEDDDINLYDDDDNDSSPQDSIQLGDNDVFGPRVADLIVRCLVHMQLPGLTHMEQLYIIAIADSLANVAVDNNSTGQ